MLQEAAERAAAGAAARALEARADAATGLERAETLKLALICAQAVCGPANHHHLWPFKTIVFGRSAPPFPAPTLPCRC